MDKYAEVRLTEAADAEEGREGLSSGRKAPRTGGRGRSGALAAIRAEKGRRAREAMRTRRQLRDVTQLIRTKYGVSRVAVSMVDVPPMNASARIAAYTRQNGGSPQLTPAQRRRLHKKARKHGELIVTGDF